MYATRTVTPTETAVPYSAKPVNTLAISSLQIIAVTRYGAELKKPFTMPSLWLLKRMRIIEPNREQVTKAKAPFTDAGRTLISQDPKMTIRNRMIKLDTIEPTIPTIVMTWPLGVLMSAFSEA